jgi:hypothetical protein
MIRCPEDCIMTAATLRQTAAPAANVNNDIHTVDLPLLLLIGRGNVNEPTDNATPLVAVPGAETISP